MRVLSGGSGCGSVKATGDGNAPEEGIAAASGVDHPRGRRGGPTGVGGTRKVTDAGS